MRNIKACVDKNIEANRFIYDDDDYTVFVHGHSGFQLPSGYFSQKSTVSGSIFNQNQGYYLSRSNRAFVIYVKSRGTLAVITHMQSLHVCGRSPVSGTMPVWAEPKNMRFCDESDIDLIKKALISLSKNDNRKNIMNIHHRMSWYKFMEENFGWYNYYAASDVEALRHEEHDRDWIIKYAKNADFKIDWRFEPKSFTPAEKHKCAFTVTTEVKFKGFAKFSEDGEITFIEGENPDDNSFMMFTDDESWRRKRVIITDLEKFYLCRERYRIRHNEDKEYVLDNPKLYGVLTDIDQKILACIFTRYMSKGEE